MKNQIIDNMKTIIDIIEDSWDRNNIENQNDNEVVALLKYFIENQNDNPREVLEECKDILETDYENTNDCQALHKINILIEEINNDTSKH